MAIPFYENEEQQHQISEEIDQVDGPVIQAHNLNHHQDLNNIETNQVTVNQQDLMAWKILALAMCKALKDHYQQNMVNSSSSASNSVTATNSSSSSTESSTAVIQILPNGQVKPQWN